MKELARRINFFTASFIAILGFSLVSEVFMEDDVMDKIDDVSIVLLAIAGIVWYKKVGHKAAQTTGALILLILGICIKIGAVIIEHADKEAVGDDIGILVGLIMAFIFVAVLTYTHRKEK